MGIPRQRVSRFLNGGGGKALVILVILGVGAGAAALWSPRSDPPPPPLVIGHAPAAPAKRIQVVESPDPYGYNAVPDWPSACDLLTDQDIHSIFPAATGDIQRKGVESKILVSDESGQTAGEELAVPNGSCDFDFHLPSSHNVDLSEVSVVVDGVGDPKTLREGIDKADDVADGCTYRPGHDVYLCGWVEVGASVAYLNIDDDSHRGQSVKRFRVGNKVTSFDVTDSLGKQADAEQKFEDTVVTPLVLKAVLAKLA
jgi:hypothetical protein